MREFGICLVLILIGVNVGLLVSNFDLRMYISLSNLKQLHEAGVITLIAGAFAILAVIISQRGLARLQRETHQRDTEVRLWDIRREKMEQLRRLFELGQDEIINAKLSFRRHDLQKSVEQLLDLEAKYKRQVAESDAYFSEFSLRGSGIETRLLRCRNRAQLMYERRKVKAGGPPNEWIDLEKAFEELIDIWLMQKGRIEELEIVFPYPIKMR